MSMSVKAREVLEALAQDKLPHFDSLGALHRAVNPLLRQGLVEASRQGEWVRYSLTQAGRDRLAGERPRGVNPFDRPVPTFAQQQQYMIDAVNASGEGTT
jgi:DNA-binding transcriptional ArsR family regulator